MGRLLKLAMVSLVMVSASCKNDEGTGNATACAHVTTAEKYLQTFLQNHPVGGAPDPQSQIGVLDKLKSELDAASQNDPADDLAHILTGTIEDASHMQADIAGGKPVTSAALISDFDNLDSECGQLKSSSVTVPS
jgi:hypothetical protein